MDIVGFDFHRHFIQRQRAVGVSVDGLRLNTAQHRCATGFKQIVMRGLTDNILFATFAVTEQSDQVGLSAGRQKNGGFFTGKLCCIVLQSINGRVVSVNVVPNRGGHHRFEHGAARSGYGITA